jgi:hypothetical protein
VRDKRLYEIETCGGTRGHGDSDGAVELDDRRWGGLVEDLVKVCDAVPIRVGGSDGAGMAGGDGGLENIGAGLSGELLSMGESGEAAADEELVPAGAILIKEEDGLAGGCDAGVKAGGLNLHQGDEAVDLGFVGSEFGEDAAKAKGFFAESGAGPVVAGGGGVALVEDEVDNLKDRGEAAFELFAAREFEGDFGFGEGALGANDALSDSRLREEDRAGDLVGGEAAEETEGEGNTGFGGEDGVAGDEDEAEEIVGDRSVDGGVNIVGRELTGAL